MLRFCPISRLGDLRAALGGHFVVFAGSAVSGKAGPRLPMSSAVLSGLLNAGIPILQRGTYPQRLAGSYALSLLHGRHAPILATTKFEQFLWHVEAAAGRNRLDDLLSELFACSPTEYGPNQDAIAWLLRNNIAPACLTTNFDNSIELADPTIAVCKFPQYPAALPGPSVPPLIVKLHGDAVSRNCVSTSPALSDARRLEQHRQLQGLLHGKTVLVLGYSGFGDVDISPHLASCGAHFVWSVHGFSPRVPHFVRTRFQNDLSATCPSRNLLLALATSYGWRDKSPGHFHDWRAPLAQWCASLGPDTLRRIVESIFAGQAGWPVLHFYHSADSSAWAPSDALRRAMACLEVSAYTSADKSFREALRSSQLQCSETLMAIAHLGFKQWRQGPLTSALDTLWPLSLLDTKSMSQADLAQLSLGLRYYVETARDAMEYMTTIPDRLELFAARQVQRVLDMLVSLRTVDPKDDLFIRAVIADIDRLLGRPVHVQDLRELYQESYDYMLWATAELIARLLIKVRLPAGLRPLLDADRQLLRRGNWNTIRKSVATLVHVVLGCRFPLILQILDGPILAAVKTPIVEFRYARKLARWQANKAADEARVV